MSPISLNSTYFGLRLCLKLCRTHFPVHAEVHKTFLKRPIDSTTDCLTMDVCRKSTVQFLMRKRLASVHRTPVSHSVTEIRTSTRTTHCTCMSGEVLHETETYSNQSARAKVCQNNFRGFERFYRCHFPSVEFEASLKSTCKYL